MKHLTYADKPLLVDDETAELIVKYAVALGAAGTADSVELRGFGADGDEVVGSFVLNGGTVLMAETVHTSMNDPENTAAIEYCGLASHACSRRRPYSPPTLTARIT